MTRILLRSNELATGNSSSGTIRLQDHFVGRWILQRFEMTSNLMASVPNQMLLLIDEDGDKANDPTPFSLVLDDKNAATNERFLMENSDTKYWKTDAINVKTPRRVITFKFKNDDGTDLDLNSSEWTLLFYKDNV